jgi:hypothetical protein
MNVVIAKESRRLAASSGSSEHSDTLSHGSHGSHESKKNKKQQQMIRRASTHEIGAYRKNRSNSLTSKSLNSSLPKHNQTTYQVKHHPHDPQVRGCCGMKNTCWARQRGELRVWMFQSDEGALWDVWIMLLCLISVFVFIIQTYIEDEDQSTNSTQAEQDYETLYSGFVFDANVYSTTVVAEFICACFFTVDLCLNLFAARSPLVYLLCSWGLVDLLTCVPVYIEVALQGFDSRSQDADLLSILSLLRFARVFKVTRFLRELRLQRILKTHVSLITSKIISSIIVIAAIWLLFSSLVYVAEVEFPMYLYRLSAKQRDASNSTLTAMAPFKKSLSFGQTVYFSMVTFSTVGFGDISPQTTVGQWVVIIMIVLGLAFIAQRVAEVGYLLGSMSKYAHHVVPGEAGHILVIGHVADSRIVQHFLDEHLHPDHFGKVSNFLGPEDVVLVGAGKLFLFFFTEYHVFCFCILFFSLFLIVQ